MFASPSATVQLGSVILGGEPRHEGGLRKSTLRLGLVWTVVAQTVNGLSLTSELLNYGSFARALLELYQRLRAPVFGGLAALAGRLDIPIEIVHLDLVLLFSLLSCNTLLAMPLVLSRTAEPARSLLERQFRLVKDPLQLIAEALKAAPIPPFVLAEARRIIRDRWTDLRDHGRATLADEGAPGFLRFLLIGALVMSGVALVGIPLFALQCALYLALYAVRSLLIALLLLFILLLLPLAPITNTAYFVVQRLRLLIRGGPRPATRRQVLTAFRSEVLPWFIPLLSLLGGMFVIYSLDALIRGLL